MSIENFENELIKCLKKNNGTLLFCKLPQVYKKECGREIPHRSKALRNIMKNIPTIEVKQINSVFTVTHINNETNSKNLPTDQVANSSVPPRSRTPSQVGAKLHNSKTKPTRLIPSSVTTSQRNTPQVKISQVVNADPPSATTKPSVHLLGKHNSIRSTGLNNLNHLLVNGNDIDSGCGLIGVLQKDKDLNKEPDDDDATTQSEKAKESKETEINHREANEEEAECNHIVAKTEEKEDLVVAEDSVYIQTTAPFCAVCIGVQRAGKSHTMNVILENCMLPSYTTNDRGIITNTQPMTGLVLHYDQSQSNVCEAVGLCQSNHIFTSIQPPLQVKRMVVLVSPNFYLQRKDFYEGKGEVYPLLFNWSDLTATHLRKLMRLTESDSQLYVSVMLNKLRKYQRKNEIPVFEEFLKDIQSECNASGQLAPLQQRLELLKNFIRDSELNKDLEGCSLDSTGILAPGTLVVADLTDPMLTADEACGVFQVLLEQFRCAQLKDVGKVVAFDEAHKYLNHKGPGCLELTTSIIETIRMMRHEGIRVLLSTQSPTTMPPELLELASMTILHKFQSSEWVKYISSKVPLPEDGFNRIKALVSGQALVISTQIGSDFNDSTSTTNTTSSSGTNTTSSSSTKNYERTEPVTCLTVNIRPRLTQDLGMSKKNTVSSSSSSSSTEME